MHRIISLFILFIVLGTNLCYSQTDSNISLKPVEINSDSVSIKWNKIPGACYYRLEKAVNDKKKSAAY